MSPRRYVDINNTTSGNSRYGLSSPQGSSVLKNISSNSLTRYLTLAFKKLMACAEDHPPFSRGVELQGCLPSILAVRFNLQASQNWGSPNASYSSQSILSVCLSLSKIPANNDDDYDSQTGSGQIDETAADCYAIANNGRNAPKLDYNACLQQSASLQACAMNINNPGCLAACTSGTINAKYNDDDAMNLSP